MLDPSDQELRPISAAERARLRRSLLDFIRQDGFNFGARSAEFDPELSDELGVTAIDVTYDSESGDVLCMVDRRNDDKTVFAVTDIFILTSSDESPCITARAVTAYTDEEMQAVIEYQVAQFEWQLSVQTVGDDEAIEWVIERDTARAEVWNSQYHSLVGQIQDANEAYMMAETVEARDTARQQLALLQLEGDIDDPDDLMGEYGSFGAHEPIALNMLRSLVGLLNANTKAGLRHADSMQQILSSEQRELTGPEGFELLNLLAKIAKNK